MEESSLWAWGTILGLTVLGGSAGAAFVLTGIFDGAVFAAVLFAAMFLSCGMAMQLYRRGQDYSTLVGGLSGGLSVLAFFAVPIAASGLQGGVLDVQGVAMLLVVAPLVTGGLSAAGTLFLASGVRRYRARHGLRHAPR